MYNTTCPHLFWKIFVDFLTSTLLRAQNTALLSKVRQRFFQILWPSQITQTLTVFCIIFNLNKTDHTWQIPFHTTKNFQKMKEIMEMDWFLFRVTITNWSKSKTITEKHQNQLKNEETYILLKSGGMVDLEMYSFRLLTLFWIYWHPNICWSVR